MFPFLHFSRSEQAWLFGMLAAFPGGFIGIGVGAIRGARPSVATNEKTRSAPLAGQSPTPKIHSANAGESTEEELARLRKRVEELEAKGRNESIGD